jgi:transposase
MSKGITHVGLDVHKKSIAVAMLLPRRKTAERWQLANEPRAVKRLVRKLKREAPGVVECAYEAGPCGYVLLRQFEKAGVSCQVVAPSLIPKKPGDRVKTDTRDATKLAELLRAGLLTEVRPPTEAEEAVRDLCRCREDAKQDLTRCRHRLSKFLLRRGILFGQGRAWTHRHRRWLKELSFERTVDKVIFDDYLTAVEQQEQRVRVLQEQMGQVAISEPYARPVGYLRCFRGIDTTTALTLVAELGDVRRFESPRKLMSYWGLVQSEHSSGGKTRRGGITKAGNSHARRVVVEAAWAYRHKPAVGVGLRKRREGQPIGIVAQADRAQRRLHRRYWHLHLSKNKLPAVAIVAVARELVGFIWGALMAAAAA